MHGCEACMQPVHWRSAGDGIPCAGLGVCHRCPACLLARRAEPVIAMLKRHRCLVARRARRPLQDDVLPVPHGCLQDDVLIQPQ